MISRNGAFVQPRRTQPFLSAETNSIYNPSYQSPRCAFTRLTYRPPATRPVQCGAASYQYSHTGIQSCIPTGGRTNSLVDRLLLRFTLVDSPRLFRARSSFESSDHRFFLLDCRPLPRIQTLSSRTSSCHRRSIKSKQNRRQWQTYSLRYLSFLHATRLEKKRLHPAYSAIYSIDKHG